MKTVTLPAGADWRGRSLMPFVTIEVDETDHIGRIINRGTWYEKDLLDDAFARVQGPGTAIDVGAHIGNHALWFARAMGLSVVALEPNPTTHEQLLRNVAANDLSFPYPNMPSVRCLNAAAGARHGWGRMTEPAIAHNSGTCAVVREPDDVEAGPDHISILPLDQLILAAPVKLIKVDVEGAAGAVLVGAVELIDEHSPVIYAEGDRDAIQDALPDGYHCFGRFAKTPTYGFSR
ncbi:FkbM family methyltransferase [Glycomyces tenuis]|uniref:FkbM family methyltransferase n=1 Tax=Glycomyces tenuis TaxID=58116 RepID=UPI000422DEC2|nr:FkbM family methyltransferase [Glycomyces tenuis]